MVKKFAYSLMTGLFLGSLAFTAQAAQQEPGSSPSGTGQKPVINFDQSSGVAASGTLFYGGNGGPVTGDSITFDILTGKNTPKNSGTPQHLNCGPGRCQLNFNTGDNQSEAMNGNGTFTFDNGGNFTLTGTVLDQNGNTIDSGTLLSGSFSDTPTVSGSDGLLNFSGFGQDTQSGKISNYFGIGQNATFRFSNTDIVAQNAQINGNGGFTGDINNADITNSNSAVPEPGVLGMFGLALLMLGGIVTVRRKNLQF